MVRVLITWALAIPSEVLRGLCIQPVESPGHQAHVSACLAQVKIGIEENVENDEAADGYGVPEDGLGLQMVA